MSVSAEPVPARERLMALVPPGARRAAAGGILGWRALTGRWRGLPDTLIIGTMRGGTTSLFRWLAAHPDVAASLRKEVGYFTSHYHRGEGWYRAHFPIGGAAGANRAGAERRRLEASPDYMLDPRAAERAAALVPDARILVLLRDPVDRAWSHYRVLSRIGAESLPFEEAMEAEEERLAPAWRRLASWPDAPLPREIIDWSYGARGRYAEQLARWRACFPHQQFLLVRSEDLYAHPAESYDRVLDFLGLRRFRPGFAVYAWDHGGGGTAGSAPDDVRARHAPRFAETVARLRAEWVWDPGWSPQ